MKKIVLKNCNNKKITQLLKKCGAQDNMVFISLNGSEFESTSYNRNKSALKSVSANLETMCEEYSNPIDETVKIQFANANKLITTLALAGDDNLDIVFEIEDDNYAKRLLVKTNELNITVSCADKEAVDFLDIPENARHSIFEDVSKLQCSANISDSEFKKIKGLMGLNKDSVRVFFNLVGDDIILSEIESSDENVRSAVNDIVSDSDYEGFCKFDKLYDKKLICDEVSKNGNVTDYLGCFNKQYFDWIDSGETDYSIEFHSNKVKFVTLDKDGVKTYVVLTPVRFA